MRLLGLETPLMLRVPAGRLTTGRLHSRQQNAPDYSLCRRHPFGDQAERGLEKRQVQMSRNQCDTGRVQSADVKRNTGGDPADGALDTDQERTDLNPRANPAIVLPSQTDADAGGGLSTVAALLRADVHCLLPSELVQIVLESRSHKLASRPDPGLAEQLLQRGLH